MQQRPRVLADALVERVGAALGGVWVGVIDFSIPEVNDCHHRSDIYKFVTTAYFVIIVTKHQALLHGTRFFLDYLVRKMNIIAYGET